MGRAAVPSGGCAPGFACSLSICLDYYLSHLFVAGRGTLVLSLVRTVSLYLYIIMVCIH